MKRLFSSIAVELTVLYRNHFVWIMLGITALMVLAFYLIPKDMKSSGEKWRFCFVDPAPAMERLLLDRGLPLEFIQPTTNDLAEAIATNRGETGIVVNVRGGKPVFTILHYDALPESSRRLVELTLDSIWSLSEEGWIVDAPPYEVRSMLSDAGNIPLNRFMLPVLIVFEVMTLGFLFSAVLLFQEKREGSLKAFRVSPAGTLAYLLTKLVVWTAISTVYGALLILATVGWKIEYFYVLPLVAFGSGMMTLFGLGTAAFFDNISQWMFAGIGILIVNMIPQIAFVNPTLRGRWFEIFPSHTMLVSVRDILLYRNVAGAGRADLIVGIEFAVVCIAAFVVIDRKLMKEN
jgi:ABC-2 type transport system permease protein/fluoroquinolone transport system permease protein